MNQMSLQLIVGLGNPDKNLLLTRHNVGFWFLDLLADMLSENMSYNKKYDIEIAEYSHSGKKITLMKPMSYINNSGKPIKNFI